MRLTFGEAKKSIAQWAGRGGKCFDTDEAYRFTYKVLQYLLYSGTYGNLRKFCFHAVKGCITVPFELETPLKIRVDGCVGTVWDKWFEWYTSKTPDDLIGSNCIPAARGMQEDPNYYPTVYDLPSCGSHVGVVGICREDESAHILVQGIDTHGKEVFTSHKGNSVVGEYLSIRKGELRFSTTTFKRITGVIKTPTNGYVQLLSFDPKAQKKGFLSDYSPLEEKPSYRRYKLTSPECGSVSRVSVLGRIRLKEKYSDEDFIPIDNLYALDLAAQEINSNYNSDVATANAKAQRLDGIITGENEYKRVENGSPIEVYQPLSSGSIINIV
jgi:hypothetical protein